MIIASWPRSNTCLRAPYLLFFFLSMAHGGLWLTAYCSALRRICWRMVVWGQCASKYSQKILLECADVFDIGDAIPSTNRVNNHHWQATL